MTCRLLSKAAGRSRTRRRSAFGVRQVTTKMHEHNGSHGRQVLINGQKIFCRGGYVQPEILFDWDAERIETEIRYYAEANLNLIYFEDIPNPPESLLEACDRHGVDVWKVFLLERLADGPSSDPPQMWTPIC